MMDILLIGCLIFTFRLGFIPVKWAENYKTSKHSHNKKIVENINKK